MSLNKEEIQQKLIKKGRNELKSEGVKLVGTYNISKRNYRIIKDLSSGFCLRTFLVNHLIKIALDTKENRCVAVDTACFNRKDKVMVKIFLNEELRTELKNRFVKENINMKSAYLNHLIETGINQLLTKGE